VAHIILYQRALRQCLELNVRPWLAPAYGAMTSASKDAPNLSPAVISRLTADWKDEYPGSFLVRALRYADPITVCRPVK
jgi:hypothetical protein